MADTLQDYFAALERLKNGVPIVVSKGTKITNDSVAQEAGRGKGSIKKSRPVFQDLIGAISQTSANQSKPQTDIKEKLVSAKSSAKEYRVLWEEALAREASLLFELYEVKKTLAKLTGGQVLPIRRPKPSTDDR